MCSATKFERYVLIVAAVRRGDEHRHRDVGCRFVHGDADALHVLRQFRSRLRDAVLHEHLRFIDVGAELERDGQRHDAVAGRLRELIQHVLDAGDRLFERPGDGVGDDLRIRAGIDRANDDGRRHDFRDIRKSAAAASRSGRRSGSSPTARRRRRAGDEELGEVHRVCPRKIFRISVTRHSGKSRNPVSFVSVRAELGPGLRRDDESGLGNCFGLGFLAMRALRSRLLSVSAANAPPAKTRLASTAFVSAVTRRKLRDAGAVARPSRLSSALPRCRASRAAVR